ncbi:MAG: class I SAM-dependent methyltransferase, partial [Candidatus Heimdallarchaeaceae archaeon]
EIRKYMGPKSVFKMMVYHRYSWKVLWILLVYGKGQFWNLDQLIARYSEAQTGCPVTYTYTKESVKELLKHFKIRKVQVEHIFPYRISDYINYNYVKTWYFRWMPDSVFKWLERKLGWHLCVEATL